MKHSRFLAISVAVATLAAATFAATATSAAGGTNGPSATNATAVLHVGFAVQRFVKQGTHLVAIGRTISTITSADGSRYTKIEPFTSRVVRKAAAPSSSYRTIQSAARTCSVLNLTLGPLHLALLGLIVDLNQVNLTITADSNGGLLGSLLCGLAGGGGILGTATNAAKLTNVAQTSGLAAGPGINVPLVGAVSSGSVGTQAVQATCSVLDLTLGPLDLNLLGLMVHLSQVHLVVTADPTGGLLGSLLCGLAGGVPTG
jgi:hypothetical protein